MFELTTPIVLRTQENVLFTWSVWCCCIAKGRVYGVGGGGGLYAGVDWLKLICESEGGKMSVNMVRGVERGGIASRGLTDRVAVSTFKPD